MLTTPVPVQQSIAAAHPARPTSSAGWRSISATAEAGRHELPQTELKLKGTTRVEDVLHSYGIALAAAPEATLDEVLRQALAEKPQPDATAESGGVLLTVRDMVGPRITTVGVLPPALNVAYESTSSIAQQ